MSCTCLRERCRRLIVIAAFGLFFLVSPTGCSRSQPIEPGQTDEPLVSPGALEASDQSGINSHKVSHVKRDDSDRNRSHDIHQRSDHKTGGRPDERPPEDQAVAQVEQPNERAAISQPTVTPIRTPNGGIQPQAVQDAGGVVHLIYFKGDPASGDLFYVRKEPGADDFSSPIQVNSQSGSAIAVGTIRGGQIAVGRNGRVHVAWNGNSKAKPRGPLNPAQPQDSPYNGTPMLYARMNDGGTAFESQRNLMQKTFALDGGGTVAADPAGNVYVVWHGSTEGAAKDEEGRQVWVARSTDDGKTFSPETPAWSEATGACGCCGMRAFVDSRGTVFALYRSATQKVNRDMFLISSRDTGNSFQGERVDRWQIKACPMSSAFLTEVPSGVLAAWETNGQVYCAKVDPNTLQCSQPIPAPGRGKSRKHPVIAGNARGEMILVWTEGTGWNRGGSVAWQVFDQDLRPTGVKGSTRGVSVWSLAAVFTRQDGGFSIVY